jgi:hypothetical protein
LGITLDITLGITPGRALWTRCRGLGVVVWVNRIAVLAAFGFGRIAGLLGEAVAV